MSKKCAFTLIEFLIVVGILAILAVIALPNFLEARTRSEVARVKAEMSTLATGLESYRTDHGAYPDDNLALSGHPSRLGVLIPDYSRGALSRLSTPVAYLTQGQITDPFATLPWPAIDSSAAPELPPFCYGYFSTEGAAAPLAEIQGLSSIRDAMVPQAWINADLAQFNAHHWLLQSVGPDGRNGVRVYEPSPQFLVLFRVMTNHRDLSLLYDPSNGTTSTGDIFRTGKGVL